jgi:hypothetical protein
MSNSVLSNLLGSRVFGEKLTGVIDIKSDIFEGLEDPEVNYVSELSDSSVYISCSYEMRTVDLVVTIDLVVFEQVEAKSITLCKSVNFSASISSNFISTP